ncbi:ORF IV [Nyavirus nyamaniniense]|uniref:ORF IV n=1 Tax=Nyavirus nyamaniniense TaxID=644610 RepID=C4NFL7_9MONO|nr:ORF IV [Nyavirus nyamaniniense]ACQ94983.1 ORF IV [Nyavirus nyamaniniense]
MALQVKAKEASIWYQARVKTPTRELVLSVPILKVPRKGEFSQRPDPSVFRDSKACIFIHDKKPFLRVELDPLRHKKTKVSVPQSQVINLADLGWTARDFAAHPMSVRYERVIFKEPCSPLLDEKRPFLFAD